MAVLKFSQIAAGATIAAADTFLGVQSGGDVLWTGTQVRALIATWQSPVFTASVFAIQNALTVGTTLTVTGTTTLSGILNSIGPAGVGTRGQITWDGSASVGGGIYMLWNKNSVQKWQDGFMSVAAGNTSDSLYRYRAGSAVFSTVWSETDDSVAFGSLTASTTTTTGAVTVAGGIGVLGAGFFGGTINAAGVATLASGTATPAGGSTAARLVFGTTAGFGIYYGSGAPSVTAAAGSLYIRTDNAGASLRLYSNTTGASTWAAITSA